MTKSGRAVIIGAIVHLLIAMHSRVSIRHELALARGSRLNVIRALDLPNLLLEPGHHPPLGQVHRGHAQP